MSDTKFKTFMDENMIGIPQLAKALHVPLSTIYNYRNNGVRNVNKAYAIAYVLKCDHADILETGRIVVKGKNDDF